VLSWGNVRSLHRRPVAPQRPKPADAQGRTVRHPYADDIFSERSGKSLRGCSQTLLLLALARDKRQPPGTLTGSC
jgi:hypothetical protein